MTSLFRKGIFFSAFLLVGVIPALNAEDLLVSGGGRERPPTPKRVWFRRATLAAACAASLGFDTITTRRAIANGAIETNGLLANSNGQPAWARMIGFKVGSCAVSAVLQETHTFGAWKTPASDKTWTVINSGIAAEYTWAGFHNLNLK